MRYGAFILALAALVLAACRGDHVETINYEESFMTIHASLEGAPGATQQGVPGADEAATPATRTTVLDGGTQVYWEPADEIKVFFNGNGGRFVSQNTSRSTVASFKGTLSVVIGAMEGAVASDLTWGLYPYRADAVSDGVSVTTTLPAGQVGREGSFAKNTHISLACSEGHALAFYNVCGGLRFSLTQEGIKRVTFEGNDGETLAGRIKLAFADGVPAVQEVTEGQTVLELTAAGGGTFQTGQWFYFEAIPGSLAKGYKMMFYKESESAKLTSSSAVTFRRGRFGSLADVDEDLLFKPSGSSEPDPNDVIQFKDPIAKYACVEKFDTNQDGEVSYAEAAAVTTLSGLFKDWTDVTEFDEIQYFTSVSSTSGVFNGLKQLKHITIPDNITTLGTFENCSSLDTVKLPAALTSLPTSCFYGCSALKSVTLPTGITSIPDNAFLHCTSLTALSVPSTITSVNSRAFEGCSVLTGIDLPAGLKTIGYSAFRNCQAIASVDFPASLTSIGLSAYSGCTALSDVTIRSGVSLGSYAFSNCTNLTSAVLSEGVGVDQYAFSGCSSLASVVLPEDMTSIPAYCFQNCTKLATIIWPAALTTIGDNAFDGCRFADNNYTLQLPSTVTTIGWRAFGYLHHLILPSTSAISIASNSFAVGYTILYVPANMVEMYKMRTNWSNYADQIRPISDYPAEPSPVSGGNVGTAVDLGLSVKWASCNVGATQPEGYGINFEWGETDLKQKSYYYWDYYKWGSYSSLTKYNTSSSYGTVDNKTQLDFADDAAFVNWGGAWRMPTDEEWTELRENCIWTWTTQNGVNGMLVTATNGNSIFLPAAGEGYYSYVISVGSSGYYWSSSLKADYPPNAWFVSFNSSNVNRGSLNRYYGPTIRPVLESFLIGAQ